MFENPLNPAEFKVLFFQAVGHNSKEEIVNLSRRLFDVAGNHIMDENATIVEKAQAKLFAAAMMAAGTKFGQEKSFEQAVSEGNLQPYERDQFFACHNLLWAEVARIAFDNLINTMQEDMQAFFARIGADVR